MRQLSEGYAQSERLVRERLTGGFLKTNGRCREPVAMLGVAPFCASGGFPGPRAGLRSQLLDK
jgi:hypothetical protein